MSIVRAVLEEEYARLKNLAGKYRRSISRLPTGSISIKRIAGHNYAYLVNRRGKKIHFEYVGKESSTEVDMLRRNITERKVLEKKLKPIKNDLKELERALLGRKV